MELPPIRRGGDVIKLVEHLDGCDFITACTTLTGRHGHDARRHGEGLWLSIGAVDVSVRPSYFFRRPGLGPAAID